MNCFFCKGDIEESTTNYIVNLTNCIIIIKNVPCTKCTQCGESFFDDDVAMQLEKMIDQVKSIVSDVAVFEYSKMVA